MEEVKKEVDGLLDDFDSLLYYDKKALDKRTAEWESKQEGKREMIRNMLRKGYDIKEICKVSGFNEYQVNEIKYNIEHFNNWD